MKKRIIFLIFLVLFSSLVFGSRDNDIVVWNVLSNTPSRTNDIIVWNPTSAVNDTCTYVSGDFNIDCSDYCTVDVATDVGGNDVLINGTGEINITANITNYGRFDIKGINSSNRCNVHFR